MEITVDTTKDSHESIKKVIKLLQSIVGEDAMTNSPEARQYSPMDIFGDTGATAPETPSESSATFTNIFGSSAASEPRQEQKETAKADDEPISDRALFADLFTEEELKKMESESSEKKEDDANIEEPYAKKPPRPTIEFY